MEFIKGFGANCESDIILNTIQHELHMELSTKNLLHREGGKVNINTHDEDNNGVLYFDIEYEEDYITLKNILTKIIKKYNLDNLQGIDLYFICNEEKKLLYDIPALGKKFSYYSIYLGLSQNFYQLFEYCYKLNLGRGCSKLYLSDDIIVTYDIFEDRTVKKVYANDNFVDYGYTTMGGIDVDNDKLLNEVLHNNFSNINFEYNYHNRPFKNPMEVDLGNSTVRIAKSIRDALKVICKDIKFSVRKSNYNKINVKTDEVIDEDLGEYIKKTIGCFNHDENLLNKYGNDLIINFNF